jgi:hypothetical protein
LLLNCLHITSSLRCADWVHPGSLGLEMYYRCRTVAQSAAFRAVSAAALRALFRRIKKRHRFFVLSLILMT